MTGERQQDGVDDAPRVAIRRHTDRCFHAVEEVVPEGHGGDGEGTAVRGYIIDGVMIDADDVAEVRLIPGSFPGGKAVPGCLDAKQDTKG